MELAIIALAREWRSDIEWTAHAALAAKAGVPAEKIEAIRTGKPLQGFTDAEQTVVRFAWELLREKKLSDATFAAAQKLLGTRGVVDLTLTCGYYTAINMAQLALKPEMEPGTQSTL
jgi:4-carboxymuconolactone decarboxylase